MPKPGNVFTAKLPDGRYTAVRVLQTSGRSSLVSTTEYLGHDRPKLDDPLLRTTVIQHRFSWNGEPALTWFDRAPPENFEFLGNIPPTGVESEMECKVYGGYWSANTGNEAFLEWRWLHDRAAFEEEVRKQNEDLERRRHLPQKPKKMMAEDGFWSIIDRLDWEHGGDDEKVLAPAIEALSARSAREICQFEERLAFLLSVGYQSPCQQHWRGFL